MLVVIKSSIVMLMPSIVNTKIPSIKAYLHSKLKVIIIKHKKSQSIDILRYNHINKRLCKFNGDHFQTETYKFSLYSKINR